MRIGPSLTTQPALTQMSPGRKTESSKIKKPIIDRRNNEYATSVWIMEKTILLWGGDILRRYIVIISELS